MHLKLLVTIFALFILSGCAEKTADAPFPGPLALGAHIATFTPPAITENTNPSGVIGPVGWAADMLLPDPNGVIDLQQTLALALMENPELKSFSWQVRAAGAAELQASLSPNPELSLYVEDFGGSGSSRRFRGYESTLLFSQLIEVGGKRQKRQHVASLEKEITGWNYETKRLDVFTNVIKAYTDVLSAQQRLELSGEFLRLSDQIVKTISDRVKAGKDAPLDETKAQIVLANIRILHRQAKNELNFARTELASLWSSVPSFKKVSGKLTMPAVIPSFETISANLDNNPQVARSIVAVDKAKAACLLEKALGKQDVTISGGVKRIELEDANAFIVGVSFPIPASNRNQGNRRRAIYRLASARQLQRAVRDRLQTELAEQYKEMANAFTAAKEYREKIIPAAKGVFKASKTGYTQGKLDYLDVLNSQQMLFKSLSRHVEALRDYHKAKAQLERIIARPIN